MTTIYVKGGCAHHVFPQGGDASDSFGHNGSWGSKSGAFDYAPLSAKRDKLLYVPVRVNGGSELWFSVDSGAPHSIIDAAAARRLKIQIVSHGETTGVGKGSIGLRHAAPANFQIGNVTLRVVDPWVLDLSKVPGRKLDGLIGADFFAAYVVRIDPLLQNISFYRPQGFHYHGSGAAIPLNARNNRLFICMKLSLSNGIAATHRVRIDLGSGDAVSDDLVKRAPERRKSLQGVGLGKPYIDYSGVFETVQIGPYKIHHSWGPANPRPAVGMEIFRRFIMVFDVPHRRLYLEPNAHLHDPVPSPAAQQ